MAETANKTMTRNPRILQTRESGFKYTLNINGTTSEQVVVPVIMMVPGVHNGSHGAMLHTAENLQGSAEDWNGKPVVIGHPQDSEGNYISANSEGVVHVGVIANARYEDDKLRADLVLNLAVLQECSVKAYQAIIEKQPIDVSIGAYSEEQEQSGEWNGEVYEAVTKSYQPDHLAILPNQIGACSWDDGCGIRVNQINQNKTAKEMERNELIQALLEQGVPVIPLQVNEEGMQEFINKVYRAVNALDNEYSYNYLEDCFKGYFIYRREPKGGTTQVQSRTYRQDFHEDENGTIMFDGEPQPVQKTVTYKPIQINEQMTEIEKKTNALIANSASGFTECDRAWLLTQSEETLEYLNEHGKKIQTNEQKPVEITTDALKETLTGYSEEQIMGIMPESMKQGMMEGLKLYAEKRNELVTHITTHAGEVWKSEDLKSMTMEMLERIFKTIKTPVNYQAAGASAGVSTESKQTIKPLRIE